MNTRWTALTFPALGLLFTTACEADPVACDADGACLAADSKAESEARTFVLRADGGEPIEAGFEETVQVQQVPGVRRVRIQIRTQVERTGGVECTSSTASSCTVYFGGTLEDGVTPVDDSFYASYVSLEPRPAPWSGMTWDAYEDALVSFASDEALASAVSADEPYLSVETRCDPTDTEIDHAGPSGATESDAFWLTESITLRDADTLSHFDGTATAEVTIGSLALQGFSGSCGSYSASSRVYTPTEVTVWLDAS